MADTTIDFLKCPECDLRDRHSIAQDYYAMSVARFDQMFKWHGLPDTIPEYILERYLKINGWCGIGKAPETAREHAGKLVCFFGGLGETPDMYYQPTAIIMANPVLGSKSYEIGKDVVWAKNDSLHRGISQLIARYSHLLAANDISINIAQVTTRIPFMLTAETQTEIDSAKAFIKQAEEGQLAVVKSSAFNNGVSPQRTASDSSAGYIKTLIELHQYLKAQLANDLGVGSNYNMKRERLTTAESENDSPYLLTMVDEMLEFRKKACDEVNEMFGANWSVELNSAWKLENIKQTNESMSSQLDNPEETEDKDNE